MPVVTVRDALDNRMYEDLPNNNFGAQTRISVSHEITVRWRSIISLDLSSLDIGKVNSATLSLWYFAWPIDDPVGHVIDCNRLIRTDWVELESTWNNYKSGIPWSTVGGDYTETDKASAVIPASTGQWVTFDIKALVEYAIENDNGILHVLLKFSSEVSHGFEHRADFRSNNYSDGSLGPKIDIDYELIGSGDLIYVTDIKTKPYLKAGVLAREYIETDINAKKLFGIDTETKKHIDTKIKVKGA